MIKKLLLWWKNAMLLASSEYVLTISYYTISSSKKGRWVVQFDNVSYPFYNLEIVVPLGHLRPAASMSCPVDSSVVLPVTHSLVLFQCSAKQAGKFEEVKNHKKRPLPKWKIKKTCDHFCWDSHALQKNNSLLLFKGRPADILLVWLIVSTIFWVKVKLFQTPWCKYVNLLHIAPY